jgi:hypothetical protein
MKKTEITSWIEQSLTSDLANIAAITLRIDGSMKNGAALAQTAWSHNATGSIAIVIKALDWTITELRRRHRNKLKFVAFLGGESSFGVVGHFHALLEFPAGVDKELFIQRLEKLWAKKVAKALKQTLKTSVYAEPVRNKEHFSQYCQRFEGTTFGSGSSKVVMSKSLSL